MPPSESHLLCHDTEVEGRVEPSAASNTVFHTPQFGIVRANILRLRPTIHCPKWSPVCGLSYAQNDLMDTDHYLAKNESEPTIFPDISRISNASGGISP